MGNTVKQRIEEFIISSNLSSNKFEKQCGLSNGYLRQLRKSPTVDKIEMILSAFPELNRDWLLYGEGEMLKPEQNAPSGTSIRGGGLVPLIPDEAIAGYLGDLIDGVTAFDCRLITSPFPGAEIAIQVSGDSMSPQIKSGDRLYLRKIDGSAFIPWGHAVVLDTVNGAVVKEIQPCKEDDDFLLAVSVNPKYPPYKIEKSAIRGIYKILGTITINSTY